MAHTAKINCLRIGRKSGRVLVTGGEDKCVNMWAIGKPNVVMVIHLVENRTNIILEFTWAPKWS